MDIQSGNLLCKSFSPNPFWVMFGNVDSPEFLKNEENWLHRNKKGYGFLLVPTMSIGNVNCFGKQNINEFIEQCFGMGLREHPNYFLAVMYSLILSDSSDKAISKLAEEFKQFYTTEELFTRLAIVHHKMTNYYFYQSKFDNEKGCFICTNQDNNTVLSMVEIINIIIKTLNIKTNEDFLTALHCGIKAKETFLN